MHPITLPIAELKPALAGLGKVINSRSTLPVLHHLKIERTNDGWIALTGTDLDRFVTMRLEQPAEGPPVAVLVPYGRQVAEPGAVRGVELLGHAPTTRKQGSQHKGGGQIARSAARLFGPQKGRPARCAITVAGPLAVVSM